MLRRWFDGPSPSVARVGLMTPAIVLVLATGGCSDGAGPAEDARPPMFAAMSTSGVHATASALLDEFGAGRPRLVVTLTFENRSASPRTLSLRGAGCLVDVLVYDSPAYAGAPIWRESSEGVACADLAPLEYTLEPGESLALREEQRVPALIAALADRAHVLAVVQENGVRLAIPAGSPMHSLE